MDLLPDASYQLYIAGARLIEVIYPPHPQLNLLIILVGLACMDYVAKHT